MFHVSVYFMYGSYVHLRVMHETCVNHAWFKTLELPCIKHVCDRYIMVYVPYMKHAMHEVSHYIISS